jgi:hypothetical protein
MLLTGMKKETIKVITAVLLWIQVFWVAAPARLLIPTAALASIITNHTD